MNMKLFHFALMCLCNTLEFKNICSQGLNEVLIPESCTSCENLNSGAEENGTVNVCFGNDQCFHFQGNLLFQRNFADRKEKEIKSQGNGHPIWGIPSHAHVDFTCFSYTFIHLDI